MHLSYMCFLYVLICFLPATLQSCTEHTRAVQRCFLPGGTLETSANHLKFLWTSHAELWLLVRFFLFRCKTAKQSQ